MADTARDSTAIMAAAQASLVEQRAGGRRLTGQAIGERSAAIRRRHALAKAKRMAAAVGVVLVAAFVAGLVLDGIGFTGLMLTAAALLAALVVFARWPSLRAPDLATIAKGPVRTLVGNAQLWLEGQRPALPAPAIQIIDRIGSQLDQLGTQLEGLDASQSADNQPAADDVRRLVGEHLPEVIKAYTAIPAPLRREQRAGSSPDEQLAQSLTKISGEIDSLTRQLADGALDRLAIQTRYLDTKYADTVGTTD